MRRFAVLSTLGFILVPWSALASPGGSLTTAGAPGAPDAPGVTAICLQNLSGLGVCGLAELCLGLEECDASTPCPDGKICTPNTCCPTTLAGVCSTPAFDDPGCANPGSCGEFAACQPVLEHQDFSGIEVSAIVECGSGAQMFVESECAGSLFASSPLDHARWGTAPGGCAIYASAGHRLRTGPGPIDISSCAGAAVLHFDYLLDLNETGAWDRGFVTVQVDGGWMRVVAGNQPAGQSAFVEQALSCAGGILPVGGLIEDGAWHHFRYAIGAGDSVEVRLYGETSDGIANDGQGWFFDDVRIECGDLVYENDFEGANLLGWSDTTASPPLVQVSPAGSCPGDVPNYKPCDGPGGNCINLKVAGGTGYCLSNSICGAACTVSSDCGAGRLCVIDSCCGYSNCALARCDPGPGFGPTFPTGLFATQGRPAGSLAD